MIDKPILLVKTKTLKSLLFRVHSLMFQNTGLINLRDWKEPLGVTTLSSQVSKEILEAE